MEPQEPSITYIYSRGVGKSMQAIIETIKRLREWGRHWEEKCKSTEAVNEVLRRRVNELENYVYSEEYNAPAPTKDIAPAEHTVPEKDGLKLFRKDYPQGHPEGVKTHDLFVWAAFNKETGQVDMAEIEEFNDELGELNHEWEWLRFRLVPEPEINTEVQDG